MKSLDLAAQYLGKQETEGQNEGPVLKTIRACLMPPGTGPCSWCILFVAWALCRAYGPVSQIDYKRWLRANLGFLAAPGEAGAPETWFIESCQSWWEWAMFRRMVVNGPQPGDIFILINEHGHAHHAGFVVRPLAGGRFETIEGNTNQGGSDNGDGVYRRIRVTGPHTVIVRLPETLRG